jgi:hypothetical protein
MQSEPVTPLYIILEAVCIGTVIMGRRMLRRTTTAAKIARYRWATFSAAGWAVLVFVRLVTHTYT